MDATTLRRDVAGHDGGTLGRRQDAAYAAEVLAAWAARYLPEAPCTEAPPDAPVRVAETGDGVFQQPARAGRHRLILDEPTGTGGGDTGPTPYDLLAASLGACTAMTLRMYARHKGLALGRVSVEVTHGRIHAEDCRDCETRAGKVDRFQRVIAVEGTIDAPLRDKLLEIADRCAVHRTLTAQAVVATRLADPRAQRRARQPPRR